jgi:hypothetical protein
VRVLLRFEKRRIDGRWENVWVSHAERTVSVAIMPEEKDRWDLRAWLQMDWTLVAATDQTVLLALAESLP